jgi:hypothetical protein
MKHNAKADTLESCAQCPQYVVKEIEPGLPAFCLYWKEGLKLASPICRNFEQGLIPNEPVSPVSDLSTAAPPGGQAEPEDFQAPSLPPNQCALNRCNDFSPGRHLVKIISVQAYMHNFQKYAGPRARLKFKVLEGPDAGKFLFDNVSLPHAKESGGMILQRVRIAARLGLIPWGTKGTIQVNWKSLEGVVCWVDAAYKTFGGRQVLTIDNYELVECKPRTQPEQRVPLPGAEEKPVDERSHPVNPSDEEDILMDGSCFFHYCEQASYRSAALHCGEAHQFILDMAECPLGLWHKGPDGFPIKSKTSER